MTRQANALTLAVAIAAGGFAAWSFDARERAVERRDGPMVTTLVTTREVARGRGFSGAVRARTIPLRYAPPGRIESAVHLRDARSAADLPVGSIVTSAVLAPTGSRSVRMRRGERAVTVEAVVSPADAELPPGSVVDVFESGLGGSDRTTLLLAAVPVLSTGDAARSDRPRPLTLKIAAIDVAPLVRADIFARELRAVLR